MSNYLRNRPFLVIKYLQTPHAESNTRVKGWGTDGKWDVNESMVIVDRIKDRHQREAHIILDILEGRVIKNRFDNTEDTKVFAHYFERYKDDIQEAIQRWARKDPANLARLKQIEENAEFALAEQTRLEKLDGNPLGIEDFTVVADEKQEGHTDV
jgi:hypothetical protein